jgi:hypothetical protein
MMRAVVFIAVLIVTVDAISFQDLVDRAEEADHPTKPKVVPKKLAPTLAELGDQEEAAQWSTEHLLGFDQKPPADLFADLDKPQKKIKVDDNDMPAKDTDKKKKVKKAAKPVKRAVSPADIVPEEEEDQVSPASLLHPTAQLLHPASALRHAHKAAHKDMAVHASLPKPPQDAKPKAYRAHAHAVRKASHVRHPHMLAPHDLLTRAATAAKHIAPARPNLAEDDEEPQDVGSSVGSYVKNLFNKVEKKPAVVKAHKVAKATKKIVHKLETAADSKPKPKPAKSMLRGLSRSMLVDQDNEAAKEDTKAKAKAKEQADARAEQKKIDEEGDEATASAPVPDLDLDAGDDDTEEDDDETPESKKEIPKLGDFLDVSSGDDDDIDFE